MKHYKTRKRTLRPWHYSLSARLNMRAKRPPEFLERRYAGKFMKLWWGLSFRR